MSEVDEALFDPRHRFVSSTDLRAAYLHYDESRNPTAATCVTLPQEGLELGIVSSASPSMAWAISSLLTRSLEDARCDRGGHLPPEVVRRVQREIISPDGVANLWGATGHRFILARRHDAQTHELLATILIARSKETIFFFTGRYNNLRHSTIADEVDFDQPDGDDPSRRWFDRFAFPDVVRFKPRAYHHIANFVVSPDQRLRGLASLLLDSILRYYARDYLDQYSLPVVHSQHLLCGRGFWQIGDPPWLARMKRLGFYRRWGAESFFIEQAWAPLPPTVMNGQRVDNQSYDRLFGFPACYATTETPHPSEEHLFDRVPEVLRLAQAPHAKLQYYQALFDFASAAPPQSDPRTDRDTHPAPSPAPAQASPAATASPEGAS
jgi:GNAT superfamily N-acetyltransferase